MSGVPVAAESTLDGSVLKSELRGQSIRGGVITLLSQGCKFILTVGSLTILARLLTPSDFGLLAMAFAIITFGEMFSQLGLSVVTVQKHTITNEQVNAMFWLNVVLGLSGLGLMQLLAPWVGWFYGDPRLTEICRVLSVVFVLGALAAQHRALLSREMKFLAIAANELASLGLGIAIGVAAAWAGWGYWSLVLMYLVRDASSAAGFWQSSRWRPSRPASCAEMGAIIRFGGNLTGGLFINSIARHCDSLLLGWWSGAHLLGLYSKAYQIAMMPNQFGAFPLTRVLIPTLSRLQRDRDAYRTYHRGAATILAAMEMPVIAFFFVNGRQLVELILGQQWIEAATTLQVLAIAAFFGPIATLMDWTFISLGRVDRQLRYELVVSGATILAFVLGVRWGPNGMAWALVLVNCGLRIGYPSLRYCFDGTYVRIADTLGAMIRPGVASIAAAITLVVIELAEGGPSHNYGGLLFELAMFTMTYCFAWALLPGGKQTMAMALAELKAAVRLSGAAADSEDPRIRRDSISHQPSSGRSINVLLRYDDCSALSNSQFESHLIELLRRHGLCCTFAVIPATVRTSQTLQKRQFLSLLDRPKADLLCKASNDGVIDLAVHGFSHQTRRGKLSGYSEFAGATRAVQMQKLVDGRRHLEGLGLKVQSFVPPWNSYDAVTLDTLRQTGLSIISADFDGPHDLGRHIRSVPVTCTLPELRKAIRQARQSDDPAPLVAGLFHPFDFREIQSDAPMDLTELDHLLHWLKQQPDVCVRTVHEIAGNSAIAPMPALRNMQRIHRLSRFSPATPFGARICWSTLRHSRRVLLKLALVVILFYTAILAAAVGAGQSIRWLSIQESWSVTGGSLALAMTSALIAAIVTLRNADRRVKLCVLMLTILGFGAGKALNHSVAAPGDKPIARASWELQDD